VSESPKAPSRKVLVAFGLGLVPALLAVALVSDLVFTNVKVAFGDFRAYLAKARGRAPVSEIGRVKSDRFHHALKPLFDGNDWYGPIEYRMRTNDLAMVDEAPVKVPLRTPAPRVLLLGDSFTEGIGVPFEGSFAGKLRKRWRASGVEVLNGGTASYSPVFYYRKAEYLLETVGLELDWVVVFLDLSDIHDESFYVEDEQGYIREKGEQRERFWILNDVATPLERFLARHTTLVNSLRQSYSCARKPDFCKFSLGHKRALWPVEPALYEEFGRSGLQTAAGHLEKLQELLTKKGIGLTLVVYPWPDNIYVRDLNSKQVAYWKSWSEKRKVPFVNLFPEFINGEPATEVMTRDFLPGDNHWNEAGHSRVAEAFARQFPLPKKARPPK
jgi:lysophospholipase L1-like esterase